MILCGEMVSQETLDLPFLVQVQAKEFSRIAQLVERKAVNFDVTGSIPVQGVYGRN